jgi:hypothetical protein
MTISEIGRAIMIGSMAAHRCPSSAGLPKISWQMPSGLDSAALTKAV